MIATEQEASVKQAASRLFSAEPDWITFYKEILGLRGIVRRMYPTREQMAAFEQTPTYQEIMDMLAALRRRGPAAGDSDEPTRVITVRLPKSLHDALRVEAHEHCTSMNKLCISKLLQFIDGQQVPAEVGGEG